MKKYKLIVKITENKFDVYEKEISIDDICSECDGDKCEGGECYCSRHRNPDEQCICGYFTEFIEDIAKEIKRKGE